MVQILLFGSLKLFLFVPYVGNLINMVQIARL